MQIKPYPTLEEMRQNNDRNPHRDEVVRYAVRKSPYSKKPSLDDYDRTGTTNRKRKKWN